MAEWCFVLEEQMSEPRFGFDVPVPPPGQPQGTAPNRSARRLKWALKELEQNPTGRLAKSGYNAYKALSWTHVGVQPGGFAGAAVADHVGRAAIRVVSNARG